MDELPPELEELWLAREAMKRSGVVAMEESVSAPRGCIESCIEEWSMLRSKLNSSVGDHVIVVERDCVCGGIVEGDVRDAGGPDEDCEWDI